MTDTIAILALIASLLTFGINLFVSLMLHWRAVDRENALDLRAAALEEEARQRDARVDKRELRVEMSTAYLQLELASIDVFRFRAAHWDAVAWAETGEKHGDKPLAQLEEEANQFYFQSLNLFEVCCRFRHAEIIDREVFGSWVAWFYEVLESPYFREKWGAEYCDNYTAEIREIFDMGCAQLRWDEDDDKVMRKAFYKGVGDILDCNIIRNWNVEAGGSRLATARAEAQAGNNG